MSFLKFVLRIAVCLVLALPSVIYCERELKYSIIRQNMQTIFNYHVENKELSPLVVKRSFKIYIEHFDPDKSYLLKSEVAFFLDLQENDIEKIIKNYQKDKYEHYLLLNAFIEKSIERHRRLREEVKQEILLGKSSVVKDVEESSNYANTELELKERIKIKFVKLISLREKKTQERFSNEKKEKILNFYEKRLKRSESFYHAIDDQGESFSHSRVEHYHSLHILKAMTKSLDSHSSYYSSEEASDLRAALKKQFHGIGVVLKETEEGVYISDLITGGPAHQSKAIQVGDFLVAIDGINIQHCCFDEVLGHLRGEEGSSVELNFKRTEQDLVVVNLTREKILLNEERLTYTYEPYADGVIGKIVLPGFYDNGEGVSSEKDLREAIHDLKSKGPLYGLVIDLRENSGGFLTQAVKVAGLFISKGIIVISKYSDGEIRYMRDLDGKLHYQGPIVILTSKASASAAEIVAQALQDYGVALVVGDERTYGKGSMQYQTVTEDEAHAYFKVTVGRYYTISGRSTQIEGVKADIVVPTAFSPYNIGERYLEHPIANDQLTMDQMLSEKGYQKTLQKKYFPTIQIKETPWRKMLSVLKVNSEKRLANDPNFQCFLKRIKGEVIENKKDKTGQGSAKSASFGESDLQFKEAVSIVKDMIYLNSKSEKKS